VGEIVECVEVSDWAGARACHIEQLHSCIEAVGGVVHVDAVL
jgi:hypothetical protein